MDDRMSFSSVLLKMLAYEIFILKLVQKLKAKCLEFLWQFPPGWQTQFTGGKASEPPTGK